MILTFINTIVYNNRMANFIFKVKNSNGEIIQDSFYAENLSDAAMKLEQKGYTLLEIKAQEEVIESVPTTTPEVNFPEKTILSIQEKKDFFNAFYALYKSGHSSFEIFNSIHNSTPNEKIKAICAQILQGVKNGCSLKESMKPCSTALGKAYTMLVVAGEESGKLEDTLSGITKNILIQEKVKNDIISKATYPLIIFFLAILVALIFKTFIFEVFAANMIGAGTSIIFIAIKSLIQIIITFGIIGAIIYSLYKNKEFTSKFVAKLATIQPFKNLILDYTYSNYFSVLSLAYAAGLPISESLYLSSTVVNLPEVTRQLSLVIPRVQQGCELKTALGATMLFSDYAMSQIATGEKSGELEKTLAAIAYDYETKLRVSLDVMLKFLEPIMLGFVGLIVLIIAVYSYNHINKMFMQSFF